MATLYSLPLVLRQTPKPLLRLYFQRRGLLSDERFDGGGRSAIQLLVAAITALPDADRAPVDRDFRDLHSLANRAGAKLIASELGVRGIAAAEALGAMENFYHRAMWFLLEHGDGPRSPFAAAVVVARCQSGPGPRFRRLRNLPRRPPLTDAETLATMAGKLRTYFGHEGRGKRCIVRHEPLAEPPRNYFIAHTQDYLDTRLEYEGEELRAIPRTGVFDVVFVMLPESGVLEVRAPGDKAALDELVRIFREAALPPEDADPEESADGGVELDALLGGGFSFPVDEADGIEHVDVIALRVNVRGKPRPQFTVRTRPTAPELFLVELQNGLRPPLCDLEVNRAELRVVWRAGIGQASTFTDVMLTSPDYLRLKDEREDQIVRRCLHRWRLTA